MDALLYIALILFIGVALIFLAWAVREELRRERRRRERGRVVDLTGRRPKK